MADFVTVGRLVDLPDGAVVRLTLDGARVALARSGEAVYAVADRCSHLGVSLARGGLLDGCVLTCWLHGSRFDLRTGRPHNPPATAPLTVHAVRIHADRHGERVVSVATMPEISG